MRGLDNLMQVRRNGMRPEGVITLATEPACFAYEGWVVCDEGDTPKSADLRPFYDLSVLVSGSDFVTVDAWARAVASVGAKSVAIVVAGEVPSLEDIGILKHNGEMLG